MLMAETGRRIGSVEAGIQTPESRLDKMKKHRLGYTFPIIALSLGILSLWGRRRERSLEVIIVAGSAGRRCEFRKLPQGFVSTVSNGTETYIAERTKQSPVVDLQFRLMRLP